MKTKVVWWILVVVGVLLYSLSFLVIMPFGIEGEYRDDTIQDFKYRSVVIKDGKITMYYNGVPEDIGDITRIGYGRYIVTNKYGKYGMILNYWGIWPDRDTALRENIRITPICYRYKPPQWMYWIWMNVVYP